MIQIAQLHVTQVLQCHVYILKGKRNAYSLGMIFVRCIDCVNESVFEMLNIHICTHCDTFNCKQTMCVSRVNGKSHVEVTQVRYKPHAMIERIDFSNALVFDNLV